MATRKTATKSPAAKAVKTAKAEKKPAAPRPGRAAPAAPPPQVTARAKPVAEAPPERSKVQQPVSKPVEVPTGETRYRWIAHAAYLRAEKRGFAPGREIDDWLAAEAEFLAAFKAG